MTVKLPELWLQYASDDLKSAKVLLAEEVYNIACFHAQQAVDSRKVQSASALSFCCDAICSLSSLKPPASPSCRLYALRAGTHRGRAGLRPGGSA